MDIDLPSFFFGATIGVFPFTMAKIIAQTGKIMARASRTNSGYLYMIWLDAIAGLIFGIISLLYLKGVIPGHFGLFFASVILWAIQTQIQPQIIANRLSIIMINRRKAKWLRIGLFVAIVPLNVMVYFVWIQAHLPGATPAAKALNDACERMEKSVFLVLDLALNLFFLHLVRSRLISGGLTKYWRLLRMNVLLIGVSTALDASLLGMISLPDPYIYVQFTPLVYIIKLYIELVMANLIAKIARSDSARYGPGGAHRSSHARTQPPNNTSTVSRAYAEHSSADAIVTVEAGAGAYGGGGGGSGKDGRSWSAESDGRSDAAAGDDYYLSDMQPGGGGGALGGNGIIVKTTEIVVVEDTTSVAEADRRRSQQAASPTRGTGIPGNWATELPA